MGEETRRYTSEEFASLLEVALGPAAAQRRALPRPGSMSLAELQDIALEAGVDPEALARAARLLPIQQESEAARILGGPARIRLEFTLPGELDTAGAERLLEAIRRATDEQGTVARTPAGLEWCGGGQPSALAVNVRAEGSESRVLILADRSGGAALAVALTAVGAGIATGITGAIIEPTGVVAVAGLVLGVFGTAALTARTIWARSTARVRRTLARVADALAEAARR